jgi:hypothetical protein
MPAIFAQMYGDAVGAGFLGQERGCYRIGDFRAARLAHRRHVIDVDSQTNHD